MLVMYVFQTFVVAKTILSVSFTPELGTTPGLTG